MKNEIEKTLQIHEAVHYFALFQKKEAFNFIDSEYGIISLSETTNWEQRDKAIEGLKRAGKKNLSLLSLPWETSEAETELNRLKSEARKTYRISSLKYMRAALARAGVDTSVLDPEGKKTAAEVEEEIKTVMIDEARKHFAVLLHQKEFYDPDETAHLVLDHLKHAGADASALDPEGKKTGKQMEEEIRSAKSLAWVYRARKIFVNLHEEWGGGVYFSVSIIDMFDALEKSGLEASALDPEGIKTSEEIQHEIKNLVLMKVSQFVTALKQGEYIKDSGARADPFREIHALLGQIGANTSAFNPIATYEEMEKALDELRLKAKYGIGSHAGRGI